MAGGSFSIEKKGDTREGHGMPNLTYSAVTETMCRQCHGESLADRHHGTLLARKGTCGRCHEGSMSPGSMSLREGACKKCHVSSPHHGTGRARKSECNACHKVGVSPYKSGIPGHRAASVTPGAGVCYRCHVRTDSGNGTNYSLMHTHHETGIKDCTVCHGENRSEKSIRLCERCHNYQAVHEVMVNRNKKECRDCHGK